MSAVRPHELVNVVNAIERLDGLIAETSGIRDQFAERIAQDQRSLDSATNTLEVLIASRTALSEYLTGDARELRRRSSTPPPAEGDWQLDGGVR